LDLFTLFASEEEKEDMCHLRL